MTKKILITGATGNVGQAIIEALFAQQTTHTIIAGVRQIERSKKCFAPFEALQYRAFDFEDPGSYDAALEGIDTLFLLRPPHISNVVPVFRPLIERAVAKGVGQILFLSVQGADKMSFIPHAKIEKILLSSGVDYCFLRPSYFMQNLTTTLKSDLDAGCIVLPAGRALFNWVDVQDIGRVGAVVLGNMEAYTNQALDITGAENLSFAQVVAIINQTCDRKLRYKSVPIFRFYRHKRAQQVPCALILVMLLLHLLPRFQPAPTISNNYTRCTGLAPTSIAEFAAKNL